MSTSKNFNLFLMDGEVTGRIKCTLSNWTGLAFKIPRPALDRCKDRGDLKQSGVYFLFGKNDRGEEEVYIGQAGIRKNGEGILYRVSEHLKDQNYFSEVVMLTTQNNSFGPTEISYLENKFTLLARENDRYIVRNSNEPNIGNVTEEKESELIEFIEYSKIVLGVLGYKIFIPLVNPLVENNIDGELFYLKRKSKKSNQEIHAMCKQTSEGFVVLKGSMIEMIDSDSLPKSLQALREQLMLTGEISNGILQKNQLFASPSYASNFVLGMASNGRIDWKNKNGITLKMLDEIEAENSK
ncbi:GIY-YIG nuclease family protein [Vaginisenegalia massiliensis]|uniref:GIY-YIG nuclease family protein n=1 Tax=Vaginisenegalia massiliensis TaxID=2058294 RepID=UPI000F52DCF9|nr:GIY-YIG nuclease family protein [Vaginisenegalia massiliensis]